MKICIVANLYPPNVLGGAEIIVEKMAKSISKIHDVIIITTSPDDDEHYETRDNIPIYYINTTRLYPPYKQTEVSGIKKPLWHLFDLYNQNSSKAIEGIIKKEKCDLIHINNFKGLSLSVFKVGKDLNIPVVFESHDFSLICPRANLIRGNNTLCNKRNIICNEYVNIQRKLLDDNVDLLISPSQFMIDKYHENNFFTDTRCVKVPLGVEFSKSRSHKEYEILDFTFIGSVGKHKGVDVLINAFNDIDDENIRLNIVGKGYDEEEFKQLAENDDRIVFHGFVDNENIKEFYNNANVIVLPSVCYDNSPLVIYESFSTSTPVVASNIGGIPELVTDGYNGFLFNPGDSEDLKEKLLLIINNKEILKSLEDNSIDSLEDDSIDIMTNAIIAEYEKLLN